MSRSSLATLPTVASFQETRQSARKLKQRFRYSKESRSGFIELETDEFSPNDLRTCLLGVPGVEYVVPHALTKTEQGNYSRNHAQERTWKVMFEALRGMIVNRVAPLSLPKKNLLYVQGKCIRKNIEIVFKR